MNPRMNIKESLEQGNRNKKTDYRKINYRKTNYRKIESRKRWEKEYLKRDIRILKDPYKR